MVSSPLNPCGAFPLFHYAENNNLHDLKQKIRSAIILHGVAYSSSSKMNLRSHLGCGAGACWCRLLQDCLHSVLLEMSPVQCHASWFLNALRHCRKILGQFNFHLCFTLCFGSDIGNYFKSTLRVTARLPFPLLKLLHDHWAAFNTRLF